MRTGAYTYGLSYALESPVVSAISITTCTAMFLQSAYC